MRRSMTTRNRAGFTLIELLVVVAIIALLISILLPSLNKAREQAKAAVCSTRLKAFGNANAFYSGQYNSFAPCDPFRMMPENSEPGGSGDARQQPAAGEQFEPAHNWLVFYGLDFKPEIPQSYNRAGWNRYPFGFSIHAKNWPDKIWEGFLCPTQNIRNTQTDASPEVDFSSNQQTLGVKNPQASGYSLNRLFRSAANGYGGPGSRLPIKPNASSGGTAITKSDNVFSTPCLYLNDSEFGGTRGGVYYVQAVNPDEVLNGAEAAYMLESLDYMIGPDAPGDERVAGGGESRSAGTYHATSNCDIAVIGARHMGKGNVLYVDAHVSRENQADRNRRGDLITAATFADISDSDDGMGNQHHVAPTWRKLK